MIFVTYCNVDFFRLKYEEKHTKAKRARNKVIKQKFKEDVKNVTT